ncbi:PBS lyase [Prochlorococcus marinus XMU1408]|uniref:PBS lyase n=1 Tax=Prochlorococcus marinus XMU1408 TaxID=2213228 RepID=A0A318R6B5_PROMR|nr:PBS lyase [Prochlorococcus marinus str. XMU1408]PYE03258.1 PBS lyase [Prochlorococcus marinus XMU1408]
MDNYSKSKPTTEEEEKTNTKEGKKNFRSRQKSSQREIKLLINGLSNQNGLVRRSHSEALSKIGAAALPELINALLHSKNVIQRRAAAKTLKLVEDPSALPHLIKALTNDSDSVVQFSAAGAIAIFGEAAVNHLIIVLENKEYTEMQYGLAAWCLGFIGAKAPNAIKKAAKSKNTNVKSAAIAALEEYLRQSQDQEAIQLVESAFSDTAENVQIEAIKLVGKLHKIESLIPSLILKLKNKSSDIRKASVLSLMQLNIKEAINPLKELLKLEQDKTVRKIINLAIKKINN